ncbi:hypothetical protein K438DRAFT_1955217 [Mycena galopus ATCC 62051]|nr:hypothetical protein K438DRAFT_1955217 [Mycena galopus ATCC 62051]
MLTDIKESEPKSLLNTNTLDLSMECQCEELEKANTTLVRDHEQLHTIFVNLSADFKELIVEYDTVYEEYSCVGEEHEGLTVKHEKLSAKYQKLCAVYEQTM